MQPESRWKKVNPNVIANKCSPRHVQSVLEDAKQIIEVAIALKNEVLSLNPNCATIGAGKREQMVFLAKLIETLDKP